MPIVGLARGNNPPITGLDYMGMTLLKSDSDMLDATNGSRMSKFTSRHGSLILIVNLCALYHCFWRMTVNSTLKLIGLLMPLSLFACKSTDSGVSSNSSDYRYQKTRPLAKQQLTYAGKRYDKKSKKEVLCEAKISKDDSGNTVLIEAGGVEVGYLEDLTFEVLKALNPEELGTFSDIIRNPDFGKDKELDLSYSLKEVNFKPQPSFTRPGFTRIAYESAKNETGQEIKQYVVVKGMTEKTIDEIRGDWEFPGGEGGLDCKNLKRLTE